MSIVLSIVILLLMLSVIIVIHEFGHFIAARAFKVRVNEFAIGMGPKFFKKQGKETLFTLRIFPIGGFCNIEGENGDDETVVDREHSFTGKPRWQRCIILFAGAALNFVLGLILLLVFCGFQTYSDTPVRVASIYPESDFVAFAQPGDEILSVDGHAILLRSDFSLFMDRNLTGTHDIELLRDGERLRFEDVSSTRRETQTESGTAMLYGLGFELIPNNVGLTMRSAWNNALDFVRLIWLTLGDLFTGQVGVDQLMGPVGIGDVVNSVVTQESAPVSARTLNLLMLFSLITVNVGVMNLLPLPGLDGGRLLFLLVEAIRRKPINPKYEGYIHAAGVALFMLLAVFIMFNDIVRIAGGGAGG